jgi:hypothetical protein
LGKKAEREGNMDIFLICLIAAGCLFMLTILGVAMKDNHEGCLPLFLLGLVLVFGIVVLSMLD